MTQYFQGYSENLPEGFMIERQGETFYCFYTIYGTDVLAGVQCKTSTSKRFITVEDGKSKVLSFSTYDEAFAFMQGFISFLQWSGFAASTLLEKVA